MVPFYSHAEDLSDRDYKKQTNEDIEKWSESPVKYIITKEESKIFKRLKNRKDKIRSGVNLGLKRYQV
jgi:hypothetical protein